MPKFSSSIDASPKSFEPPIPKNGSELAMGEKEEVETEGDDAEDIDEGDGTEYVPSLRIGSESHDDEDEDAPGEVAREEVEEPEEEG